MDQELVVLLRNYQPANDLTRSIEVEQCDDWRQLIVWWRGLHDHSTFHQRVKARITQLVAYINDFECLLRMWNGAYAQSFPRYLIEGQMEQVLASITCLDTLMEWRKKTCRDSIPRYVLENQMARQLPILLPDISDWDKLVVMWKMTSKDSAASRLIEKRMENICRDVTSWNRLRQMIKAVHRDTAPSELIEARMLVILPGLLMNAGWDDLVGMRQDVWPSTRPGDLIENRLKELINSIDASNCPEWFMKLIRRPETCPVRETLDQKVRQIKAGVRV
ncbi:MAG: hypothetical protein A3I08_04490 [Candidatus Andersenbacteria bacterium RIFCSPLOWO2_02_FULL_46_11]|nr:MAG: hypothetical protein A3I08_04490 [Candidatus Andersenbacteria bacterium RIFCSPLOWO2_02_FULL_46_11]